MDEGCGGTSKCGTGLGQGQWLPWLHKEQYNPHLVGIVQGQWLPWLHKQQYNPHMVH